MKILRLIPLLLILGSCQPKEPSLISFPRDPQKHRLCHSDELGLDILFDTGAETGTISQAGLRELEERGIKIERFTLEEPVRLRYVDNSTEEFKEYYQIDLPLGPGFVFKDAVFFDRGTEYDEEIIVGIDILKSLCLEYTKDSIILHKDCPEGYNRAYPLTSRNNRYYIDLSVNGRRNDYFFDTGLADAISLPLSDTIFAQSPISQAQDTLYVGGYQRIITDWVEERAELKMGDITRHGWAIYNDYSKHPYSINPALVFKEFVVDLVNEEIRLK